MAIFEGRVALVTGAGSGIGRATSLLLARSGARVALIDLDENEIHEVAREVERCGSSALPVTADVSREEDMREAVARIRATWNRLDVVVANAGINGTWAPLDQLRVDEWDRVLAVNLRGAFLTVRESLELLKREGGSVVVVSSVNGTRIFSNTGATAYACSKAALVAFAKMTALELARNLIRVNVICPGATDTAMLDSAHRRGEEETRPPIEFPEGRVPLKGGRPGSPEEVAELIAFLASSRASHITGTEMWIDGGESLLQG